MKSSEPLFTLLAIYIPVSVLAGILPLFLLLTERLLGMRSNFFLPFWLGFAVLSAAAASVYSFKVQKSKTDTRVHIRGAVLTAIIIYCFGSLVNLSFVPSLFSIISTLASLTVWFAVFSIRKFFYIQELLESSTRHNEGEKLKEVIFSNSSLTSEAGKDNRKIMRYYGASFLPVLLLLFCCKILDIKLQFLQAVLLFFLFVAGVCILVFFWFLQREYVITSEGLVPCSRSRPLMIAAVIVLVSAVIGLLLSSGKSLLPAELITIPLNGIFNALLALTGLIIYAIGLLFPAKEPPSAPVYERPPQAEIYDFPRADIWPFWSWLKYAVLVLAGFLFLRFLLVPFFTRSRIRFQPRRVYIRLRIWLRSIIKSFKDNAGKNLRSLSAEALASLESRIVAGYNPARVRQLRRSISIFARLIHWGTEMINVPWKPSYAPLEYCSLLASAADKDWVMKKSGIIRAGELFEKALYSPNQLSRKERDEFKCLVKNITGSIIQL